MDDDAKGRRFLQLIDKQSTIQWRIVFKLSFLIDLEWDSEQLQDELKTLVDEHIAITKELNSLDADPNWN